MPRSVGELATRESIPLSTQLEQLCSASYGPGAQSWDGEALAKSLRGITVLSEVGEARPSDVLPPLSPA